MSLVLSYNVALKERKISGVQLNETVGFVSQVIFWSVKRVT